MHLPALAVPAGSAWRARYLTCLRAFNPRSLHGHPDSHGYAARQQLPGIAGDTAANAIDLLKADHRQVEQRFQQFSSSDDAMRRAALVVDICRAIERHAQLEEEISYPAFEEAT